MGTTFSPFSTHSQVQSGPQPTACHMCQEEVVRQKAKAKLQPKHRDNNYEGGNQIHRRGRGWPRHLQLQFHFNMRRQWKEQKEVATKPQQQLEAS